MHKLLYFVAAFQMVELRQSKCTLVESAVYQNIDYLRGNFA